MRANSLLLTCLLMSGCATGGGLVSPAASPPAPPVEPAPPGPVETVNVEAECSQAARLSEVGEHKPAVDSLDAVLQSGGTCPDSVLEAVKDSRRRLADADDLARRGLEARRLGDVAAARESFRLALVVYPKYYWVQKLQQELPPESAGEVEKLRQEAAQELAAGKPETALELLEQAALLPSSGPEIEEELAHIRSQIALARLSEAHRAQQAGHLPHAARKTAEAIAANPSQPIAEQVVDFARRLGLNLFSAGELVMARDIWSAALSLDQSNSLLHQYLGEVEARLRNLAAIKDDGS